MFKDCIFSIALILVMSPAFANKCPAKVKKIDAALSSALVKSPKNVKGLSVKGGAHNKKGKHSISLATTS